MPCVACSGWWSSLAYLPSPPTGCYIQPNWIQRTCRPANYNSRSKTVCHTSGGQISQPTGLHGGQPNTHQQGNSLPHSITPSERCRHWLTTSASTWTHNLKPLGPRFWLHRPWRADCKYTQHDAHAGWRNLLRTPCRASPRRQFTAPPGWIGC